MTAVAISNPTFFVRKPSLILVMSAFLLFTYLFFLNPYLDVCGFNAHDPAGYISRAISLSHGKGYVEEFADTTLPVTVQPILFSLLLVPVLVTFGTNFFALKLFMVFLAGFFATSLYWFFSYFLSSYKKAALATLLMMASPVIFGLSHRVLADLTLFIFSTLALWALDRYLNASSSSFPMSLLFFSGLMTGLGYLTKQTAVGVIGGGWTLLLHPRFRNRRTFIKLVAYSAICSVFMGVWHLWDAAVPDNLWYWTTPQSRDFIWKNPFDSSYGLISLSEFVVRVRHNIVWGMSNNLATIIFTPFYFMEGSLAGFLISLPLVIWLMWQWGRSFVQNPSVLEGFVFFSVTLMLVKHLGMAARYMALVYPALLVYAFRGLGSFQGKLQNAVWRFLIVVGISSTLISAVAQWKNPYGSTTLRDYVAAAYQAKTLLPQESKCAAPLLTHWQVATGHKCFWFRSGELSTYLSSTSPTYVVALSDKAPRDMNRFQDVELDALRDALRTAALVERNLQHFEKIFQNGTFAIYKVVNKNG